MQCGVLEQRTVERDLVRDAVNNHGVARCVLHVDRAGLHEFCLDTLDIAGVYRFHQSAGKAVFDAEQNTNLLHCAKPPGVVLFES